MTNASRIPAFVNRKSGTFEGARAALEQAGSFDIHEIEPDRLKEELAAAVKRGEKRILISGGDGSIRTAVEAVAGTGVELAVLPSGTLNHFAKDHHLPLDLNDAANVAASAASAPTDVGRVGEHLFHGTSSIGAYVVFMRMRDRLEPRFGYKISSFLAGIWTFFRMPTLAVELDIEGKKKIFRTPMLFVAVGERELKVPTLGGRVDGGQRGLHVMVVRGRRPARIFALAIDAFARGVGETSRAPDFDAHIVDRCTVRLRRNRTRISFDGEAMTVDTPLDYSLERDSLLLVGEGTGKPKE